VDAHGSARVVGVLRLELKGSLFDVLAIGIIEVSPDAVPQVGDVVECSGKSYTITDLFGENEAEFGSVVRADGETPPSFIAIVEPLAVSQRRGARGTAT
jgi:hypothetical protein